MKKDFSFYEFTGVLLPGATLLFGAIYLFPEAQCVLDGKETSLGALGLFVIASYLAGHLIQSVGNCLENLAWWATGRPTHWITWEKPPYICSQQLPQLPQVLKSLLSGSFDDLKTLSKSDTNSIRGQLYAKIKKEGSTERINIFNGNYGMFRGIAAAAFVVAIATLFVNGSPKPWANTYVALSIFIIASYRCYRFAVHYAAEIYSQAFNLYKETTPPTTND